MGTVSIPYIVSGTKYLTHDCVFSVGSTIGCHLQAGFSPAPWLCACAVQCSAVAMFFAGSCKLNMWFLKIALPKFPIVCEPRSESVSRPQCLHVLYPAFLGKAPRLTVILYRTCDYGSWINVVLNPTVIKWHERHLQEPKLYLRQFSLSTGNKN